MTTHLQIADTIKWPFLRHLDRWRHCELCPLANKRHKTCLVRGTLPCDILFVGEGPGESEDILGYPFVGPAGLLLNTIISRAIGEVTTKTCIWNLEQGYCKGGVNFTWAFTNIVACIPLKDDTTSYGQPREPNKAEAAACAPRLMEIIQLANPKVIVTLGLVAKRFLPKKLPMRQFGTRPNIIDRVDTIQVEHMKHPSAILRNEASSGLEIKRCYLALSRIILGLTSATLSPKKS